MFASTFSSFSRHSASSKGSVTSRAKHVQAFPGPDHDVFVSDSASLTLCMYVCMYVCMYHMYVCKYVCMCSQHVCMNIWSEREIDRERDRERERDVYTFIHTCIITYVCIHIRRYI